MLVAITGASGFLGRALIEILTQAGHTCRGLSRTTQSDSSVEWVQGSLADENALRELVEGSDALVHAGLDRSGVNSLKRTPDVVQLATANVIGTIQLIEAARHAGVGRLVVISSGAVHDDILDDRPLDETHPLWPRTHYGATKAAIEAFVHSYGRGQQLPICSLRPTAIYGQADPLNRSRWFELIAAVMRGDNVQSEKGSKVVHVRDVARACLLLLTAFDVAGEVFHCSDLFVTERRIAEIVRSVIGSRSRIDGELLASRHPIDCSKLKQRGMTFGGEELLLSTVRELVDLIKNEYNQPTSNTAL